MSISWLFYDVESSDLNKVFGQVLQFAAVRVDEAFDEIETHEFFVKLNKDTLPSPDAVLVHRLLPNDLDGGFSEYEAMKKIYDLVNEPNTFNGGYNTLGYDDDVLRFGFYRNFLPPYTHGYANGCKRFDLFPMLLFYYYDGFTGIQWPEIDGKISLKLENLNKVNGWIDGAAHDALVDVRVCVALANILSKDEKRWRQVLKATYEKQFASGQCYTYLSAHLGSKNRFAAPVMCIGQHRQIKNNSYWLRLDLVDFSSEGIVDKAIIRKKVPDTNLILSKSAAHSGKAIVSKNLDWLNDHNDLWSGLVENTLNQSYEGIENIDVDAALYQSDFFSENEIDYMSKLHDTNPSEWLAVPGVSKRLLPMVQKWLWRHHWQGLDDKSLSKAIALALNPGCDFLGKPKVGYSERLHRIDELIKINNENKENLELLRNLKMYYHNNLSVF